MNVRLPEGGKILVPIDGSENSKEALDFAIQLAKGFKISIKVIHVIRPANTWVYGDTTFLRAIDEKLMGSDRKILDEAKKKAGDAGVKITTATLRGIPGEVIVETAQNEKTDLIVMGSRGLGSAARILLGSVSNFVLQNAKCPVFIFK